MIFNPKNDDKILVVSPHPDDESIGCGGLLSLYSGQCDVLLVTDGFDPELNNKEASEIRQQEFISAMELAGVNKYICLHIPEHNIAKYSKNFKSINLSGYDYIFVPNRYEIHKDHVDVYKAIKRLAPKKAMLCEYEVWTTIREPNIKLDISDVVDKKSELIKKHQSQIKDLDYVSMILGLNSYRGKSHGCDYAEYFFSIDEYKRQRKKNLKKRVKRFLDN